MDIDRHFVRRSKNIANFAAGAGKAASAALQTLAQGTNQSETERLLIHLADEVEDARDLLTLVTCADEAHQLTEKILAGLGIAHAHIGGELSEQFSRALRQRRKNRRPYPRTVQIMRGDRGQRRDAF